MTTGVFRIPRFSALSLSVIREMSYTIIFSLVLLATSNACSKAVLSSWESMRPLNLEENNSLARAAVSGRQNVCVDISLAKLISPG